TIFKHPRGRKVFKLQVEIGGEFDGALGNQADDFAADDGNAVTFRFALDHLENAMQGRLLKIGHVDGNLREIARAQIHAHGFHVAQAAIREANVLADFLSDFEVGSIEIDVVSAKKFAGSADAAPA